MKLIAVGLNRFAEVDDIDWDLSFYSWCLDRDGYAHRKEGKKTVYMHDIIAERKGLYKQENEEIDHQDQNPLNNQRFNIRLATKSQNRANSKLRTDNTTGVRGVYFDKRKNKFHAQIQVKSKMIYLGLFETLEEAKRVRRIATVRYFGEFAHPEEET